MAEGIAIKVDGVSKTFVLPHEKNTSIKGALINFRKRKKGYEKQQVLDDISFEVKKGEFFGIVGRNGSGKSTLLKLLAGIYTPDSGSIKNSGSLTPFIELGVGFNPELTGRENVFLNGALLGFSRKEMQAKYADIVEFAELERFMDQKLKNYSSGMQVRLAFSIAIRAKSDILLLDEVLAVGDEAFQKKCFQYFAQLKQEKRTVVLVTHDMESVKRFCDKALLLHMGKVKRIGKSPVVAEQYTKLNEQKDDFIETPTEKKQQTFRDAHITTKLFNDRGMKTKTYNPKDKIVVELVVDIKEDLKEPVIGVTFEKSNHETVFAVTTENDESELPPIVTKGSRLSFRLEVDNIFGEDLYIVDSAIVSKDRSMTYFRDDGAAQFRIQNRGAKGWLLHPYHKLTVKSKHK